MFISVSVPVGSADDCAQLSQRAAHAERLGFDAMFVTDHPAPPAAWLNGTGHPTLDPFVALSFIAAATTRLRVHTNLLVLAYRHALTTAKAVASLDVLSNGRVLLGVGVGYMEAEFAALNLELAGRGTSADATLELMHTAWTGLPFGEHDTVVAPAPTQSPIPIWVGGNSKAAMRRAITHGSGWSPMPSPKAAAGFLGTPGIESITELSARIAMFHELTDQAGRTGPLDVAVIPTCLSGFATHVPTTEEAIDEIGQLRSVGATALIISLPDSGWDERIAWFASEVRNQI